MLSRILFPSGHLCLSIKSKTSSITTVVQSDKHVRYCKSYDDTVQHD